MKKKICFIVSTPLTAKTFLETHFESFSTIYDVYLVANLNDPEIKNYSNIFLKEIKHIPIQRKINIIQDIKSLFLLTKYLRYHNFNVITTFTPKAGLIGISSGKLAKIKKRVHFFTGQVWHTKKGVFKFLLISLDKIVVALSTNIIVDGKPQQEFLIQKKIITANNSIVIGKGTISGIDLNRFSKNIVVRNNLRELLNYNSSDIVFMFLGRLNVDKGIIDLANAFKKISNEFENVKLLVVGPDEEDIKKRLDQILNKDYYFYGSTNVPENIIQICDVFCLPSHREAFGLSVIEASACSKPIICSDTYGLRDTIVDNVTGLRHVAHDVNSLYEKIKCLSMDNDLRNKLGIQGRRYVEENFSRELLSHLWIEYYENILSSKKI